MASTTANRDFNKAAANWDEQPGRIQMADDLFASFLREVPLSSDLDVLEFGCGTGLITMRLQPHVGRIVAVDSSEGMLAQLNRKVAAAQATNIETRFVDLARAGRLEGQYDLVVISMVLHHIPEPAAIFLEFHRILRPGGRLAVFDLDAEDGLFHQDPTGVHHNGFDRQALGRDLAAAGFHSHAFSHGATVTRKRPTGGERDYSIFLAVAGKA